jgi:hypothetical protein
MRTLLVTLAAMLALAGTIAGTAAAGPPEDAQAAASAFLTAFDAGNGQAACDAMTGRLQAALGGAEVCAAALAGADPAEAQDEAAVDALFTAHGAATLARLDEKGALYPAPGRRLATAIKRRVPSARVIVGTGPSAARNASAVTIVVDSKRSTKRQIVLYAESDSGLIVRLIAGLKGAPKLSRAGTGVAAARPPVTPSTFAFDWVQLVGADQAVASVNITSADSTVRTVVRLRLESDGWKVDDLLLPFLELFAGTG